MRTKIMILGPLLLFSMIMMLSGQYEGEGKQPKAIADVMAICKALRDFVTVNRFAPEQNGIYDEKSEFYMALSAFSTEKIPVKDPWGNNYLVYCGEACDGKYGISASDPDDFIIVSYGQDGEKECWEFDSSDPERGLYKFEDKCDLDKDIIMWNGTWVRVPRPKRTEPAKK